MTKKERAIQFIHHHLHLLQCPICYGSFSMKENKCITCQHGHTFDIAKQGYVNLVTQHIKSNYSKLLFQARHQIISVNQLYSPVHEEMKNIIENTVPNHPSITMIDLGCGEGSHLKHITSRLSMNTIDVGIDISKEAIASAAKHYEDSLWLVGDLANIPIQNHQADILLNFLSPANYEQFRRIAKENALCLKVVPRKFYLNEIRNFLEKPMEDNHLPKELFITQTSFEKAIPVQYTKSLNKMDALALCKMTPLMWNISETEINQFIHQYNGKITIDLDILVGRII